MQRILFSLIFCFFLFLPKDLWADTFFSFEGYWDLSKEELEVTVDIKGQKAIRAKVDKATESQYRLLLNIDHLKTSDFDFSSEIESLIDVVERGEDNQETVLGKIQSQYSLLDYKPVRELSGRFEIRDKKLHLYSLRYGDIACSGYVNLVTPYKLNLDFSLFSIPMDDFLNFWMRSRKYESSGDVSGEIKTSGTLDHLMMRGQLESTKGFISKLFFDSIHLNAEGVYPRIRISDDSVISETDRFSFSVSGEVDLSDHENFKKQLKTLKLSPIISDSGSQLEWTIKRLDGAESGTTEIKYLKRKDPHSGYSDEGDLDMIGVERTMEF